ncbi:unnamed protein product [Lactuca virosa]|uniref:PA domain-containing protein n=1 Tax=Lactuca virosa TaxID=75947 RepID=A0AAU9PDN5_9ASTR|nr:unnamed protein product [Lactuca virosa]
MMMLLLRDPDVTTTLFCSSMADGLRLRFQTWIDDREEDEFVGVGARFGPTLESKEKDADKSRIALADPSDCCTTPKNKLTGETILVHRGNCSFTTKANVAEAAGASAILIINNGTGI